MMNTEFLDERDERIFGARLRGRLNHELQTMDDGVGARLYAARQNALARHAELANAPRSFMRTGSSVLAAIAPQARNLALSLGVVLVMLGNHYLSASERIADLEEVESALLSDDLPIDAYLDKGFDAWLRLPVSATR